MIFTSEGYAYDSENYNECDDSFVKFNSEGDTDIEPPAKKQKTEEGSIFKSLSNKFQSLESVAPPTKDKELDKFVNGSFSGGISDDKQAESVKNIRRPANTDRLLKTRVNQGIWRFLKSQDQTEGSKMQTF